MQTRVGYVEMYTQENSGGPRLAPQNCIFTFILICFVKIKDAAKSTENVCFNGLLRGYVIREYPHAILRISLYIFTYI